jgi:small-conductance mechanosensitive channel
VALLGGIIFGIRYTIKKKKVIFNTLLIALVFILKLFEGDTQLIKGNIHNAFRYTFLVMGILTILSGFVFRRLHFRDGDNMKS